MEVLVQMCTRYTIHARAGAFPPRDIPGIRGKQEALDTDILSFRPVVIFIFCKLLNLLSCGQAETVKQARKI